MQRHNTTRFHYREHSVDTAPDPHPYLLKSDCVLLSVHPMNDCMQQRGASDCAITCSATLDRSFYSCVSCFEDKKMLGTPSKKLSVRFFQRS